MNQVHLRQGRKDFYWIKCPATPFKFARDFEEAVGMRSEDKCLTNMSEGRLKCKFSAAEIPNASAVGKPVPPW